MSLILAVLLLGADQPEPPRDSGIRISAKESLLDLQGCIIRKFAHRGTPLSVPAENGIDIDLSEPTMFGIANEARISVHIREASGTREVAIFYRHPYSVKYAYLLARGLAKRCFPGEMPLKPD